MNKTVLVSLNTRKDLDLLNPAQHYTLDATATSVEFFMRITFKMRPQTQEDVQDFLENFFESLLSENKNDGLVLKCRVLEVA